MNHTKVINVFLLMVGIDLVLCLGLVQLFVDFDQPFLESILNNIQNYLHQNKNYHQEYFRLHGEEPYCKLVVRPIVEKFQKAFERFRR